MKLGNSTKLLAEEWKKLGEDVKTPFYKRAEGERKRYTLIHELNDSGMARKGYRF